MRAPGLLMIGFSAFAGCIVSASPAPSTPSPVRWWNDAVSAAAEMTELSGLKISWIEYSVHLPPEEELADIEGRTAGRPDHPDRELLDLAAGRSSDAETLYYTAYVLSSERWRVEIGSDRDSPARIEARDGEVAFSASGAMLTVVDSGVPYPASEERLIRGSSLFGAKLLAYQAAGVPVLASTVNVEPEVVARRGLTELIYRHSGSGDSWTIALEKTASGSRSVWYEHLSGSRSVSYYFDAFEDVSSGSGPRLCRRVERVDSGYSQSRIFDLLEVSMIRDGSDISLDVPSVEELPALPPGVPPDPRFPLVNDYRDAGNLAAGTVVVADSESGDPEQRYATIQHSPDHDPEDRPRPVWVRLLLGIGIAALAGSILALVVQRLKGNGS